MDDASHRHIASRSSCGRQSTSSVTEGQGTDNSKAPSSGEPVKLTMGRCRQRGPQEVIDAWNAEHPDIQVEYVRYVNDDDGNLKLDTAMITGQDVDLYVNYTLSQTSKRVESNLALDLSQFDDYNIDEKMGPNAEGWKINGSITECRPRKAPFVALNKDALDARPARSEGLDVG